MTENFRKSLLARIQMIKIYVVRRIPPINPKMRVFMPEYQEPPGPRTLLIDFNGDVREVEDIRQLASELASHGVDLSLWMKSNVDEAVIMFSEHLNLGSPVQDAKVDSFAQEDYGIKLPENLPQLTNDHLRITLMDIFNHSEPDQFWHATLNLSDYSIETSEFKPE